METLNSGALKVAQAGKTLLLLALYPKEIFETALHEDTFVKSDEEEDIQRQIQYNRYDTCPAAHAAETLQSALTG